MHEFISSRSVFIDVGKEVKSIEDSKHFPFRG